MQKLAAGAQGKCIKTVFTTEAQRAQSFFDCLTEFRKSKKFPTAPSCTDFDIYTKSATISAETKKEDMPMTHTARLSIQPDARIGKAHKHLYGANLEHIGQAVYGGIWAEMLRDRKFAGADRMYTSPSEGLHNIHPSIGVVVPWEAENPDYEAVVYAHDNSVFYSGRQSQRIHIRRADGQPRGIKQGSLYLQAGRDYDLRLALKGEGQALTVRLGAESWRIDAVDGEWRTWRHRFCAAGENAKGALSITIESGTVWVGCASLMPSDAIQGFRADALAALREWSPSQLRWPGGNFVSAYHWEQGIGERDRRPAYLDPAWWQWESNDVGTDEFIALCRLINAEPVLTVNMGDGSAEEAAAWVEYCNGNIKTEQGARRAANGCQTPHNVRVWFVGNEQFGNWQVGHVDAETYARRYLQFARAMRAADDELTLIGVGVPANLYAHWNETVLKIAGGEMDQYSVHYYSLRTEKYDKTPPPAAIYLPKLAAWREVEQMLDATLAVMDANTSAPLPLAFDEWNTYVGAKAPAFIEDYNLADALYTGALLNACLARADRIPYSAIYHLTNVMGCYLIAPLFEWEAVGLGRGGGWVPISTGEAPLPPAVVKMPATLALELMTAHRGEYAVRCEVDCGRFHSPAAGNMPAFDDVPLVSAGATLDAAGERLYLSLVNCAVDAPMRIELSGVDCAASAEVYLVSGDSPLASNSFDAPAAITIQRQSAPVDGLTLPPHSFAMVVLRLV